MSNEARFEIFHGVLEGGCPYFSVHLGLFSTAVNHSLREIHHNLIRCSINCKSIHLKLLVLRFYAYARQLLLLILLDIYFLVDRNIDVLFRDLGLLLVIRNF